MWAPPSAPDGAILRSGRLRHGMSPAGDRGTTGQGPSGMEFVGLAVLLAAAVVVPLVLGLVVDVTQHTGPLFFFIGLLIGVIAAGAIFWTRFKRYL
jgi:F0F1-type ATP synthase assembly protein I